MKTAWFFDLDGTLADTDGDIRLAWRAALRDQGLECPDFDSRFVAGPPFEDMLVTLFPALASETAARRQALAAAVKASFARHYDASGFPATREYPELFKRIAELKAAGARVFILTNKRYAGALAMARHFGWDRVFERVYASDMYADDPAVGRLKKGELLRRALAELGIDPAAAVVVGDTHLDFEAARSAGTASVGVSWGYGTAAELKLADRVANSPAEL